MYLESDDIVNHPADEVYPLVRDQLPKLLPYLPDIEEVTEVSRDRESDTRVRVVNRWRARAAVPKMLAKFLPADLFTWTDRALWKDDEQCVEYVLEGFGYEVAGTNYFTSEGDSTRIRVTATLTVHHEKFKIPKIIFKKGMTLLEGTIRSALAPNLTALSRGLKAYFADSDA